MDEGGNEKIKHGCIISNAIVTKQAVSFSINTEGCCNFCPYEHEMSLKLVQNVLKAKNC